MASVNNAATTENTMESESLAGDNDMQLANDRLEADRAKERIGRMAGDIAEWLEQQEVEKDVDLTESSGSGQSEEATGVVAYAVAELRDLCERVERISKHQLLAKFRRARAVRSADRRRGITPMLQYSLTGSRAMLELETAGGIYDELNSGKRVVSQLIARTGIGKTTRFPAMVATRCNQRVLLVEPDTRLAKFAADAQAALVRVRTPWMSRRISVLTTMSYSDFCGQFRGENGHNMLNRFDVVIFDEAHVLTAEVMAAKTLMATYATTTSLLVCSATIEGEDVQATGASVNVNYTSSALRTIVEKGHLARGALARDRTLIIATDDREVQFVARSIRDSGFQVRTIDSASRYEDIKAVRFFLEEPDAVVNRFLVVSPEYGLGYNFPVAHVITAAQKVEYEMDRQANKLQRVVRKCSKAEVAQHCGRAGRGIVTEATAMVCNTPTDIEDVRELSVSEQLRYYVLMVAAGVKPTRELANAAKGLLPFGLTPRVAADVLAVNLPIEVALRFFAADGRVPYKYLAALTAFSEDEHDFMTSEHDEPHGHEHWMLQPMSGYYTQEDSKMPSLRVPCDAEGEIKVAIHSICAAAVGLMIVDDWQPQLSDSEAGEDESLDRPKSADMGYLPRLITNVPVVRRVDKPLPNPYAYDVPYSQQFAARSRRGVHEDTIAANLLQELAASDVDFTRRNFEVSCEISAFNERGVDRVGIIHKPENAVATPVDVHSPGGSVVMAFRATVWQQMVEGKPLRGEDALSFFHSIKNNVEGFAESDAFSGWTDVWKSVFATAADSDNLKSVKKRNYTSRFVALLMALVSRYMTAVRTVSKTSAIKAGFLRSMLSGKQSYEEVYQRQAKRGKVEIAQSEAFMRRIFEIRDTMVKSLLVVEENRVFTPSIISQLQMLLPIMKKTGVPLIDRPTSSKRFFRGMLDWQ